MGGICSLLCLTIPLENAHSILTSWNELTLKYSWMSSHLSKINNWCGDKNIKQHQQKKQYNNHHVGCLYSMITYHHICVVLLSNVRCIDSWNCPNLLHKSKYIEILVSWRFFFAGWIQLPKAYPHMYDFVIKWSEELRKTG